MIDPRLVAALANRYGLEREIGAGGMATVYLAEDLKHRRKVAVKVLRPELAAALGPERFVREITIAANLQHPHVLPVYDSGEADGYLFYVMPFIDGQTLREKLVGEGQLPIADAVRILHDLADALAEAHRSGVVHRDLKPENVMLRGRHALVTDFGVAKAVSAAADPKALTVTGMAVGTPTYMSPEQAAGDPNVDHRADIYAFGVLAYELLAGQPPFMKPSAIELIGAHVTMVPEPVSTRRAGIPTVLAELVMKCLEKVPENRWQSAEELIPLLESVLASSETLSAHPQPARSLGLTHRVRWAVAAAAVVAIALVGWRLAPLLRSTAAGPGVPRSIAVLPFVNEGADADEEYLADGIADGLISALSKVPGLKVASRNSAFRLKGSSLSVRQKADTLGVAAVLEGSMRRGLGRIRVTLQLLNAADGLAQWTETYDRPAADLTAVQDDIVSQVTRALKLEFGGLALAISKAGRSASPEANDLYLRGRFWLDKGSEEGFRRGLEFFRQAVAVDPGFAAAYAGIARSWLWLAGRYEPDETAYPKAQAAARAALARDSLLPEAHAVLGNALLNSWDAREAEMHLRRAVALDARSADANFGLAVYLGTAGQWDDGLRTANLVLELEPLDLLPNFLRTTFLFFGRLYDSTIAQEARTQKLLPGFLIQESLGALSMVQQGRYPDATQEYDRLRQLNPGVPLYGPVLILARTGRMAEARAELRLLERNPGGAPFQLAWLYGALGEPDRAFATLEQMLTSRNQYLLHWISTPLFDPLRTDPRFPDLVRRVRQTAGLPPLAEAVPAR